MPYGDKKKITIYVYEEILEEAVIKSGMNQTKLINELLLDYVSIDGSIEELERFKDQIRKNMKKEERELKRLNQCIEEKEKEKEANANNTVLLMECLERMDRYYKKNNILDLKFLKRLEKAKKVPLDKLNDLALSKGWKIK